MASRSKVGRRYCHPQRGYSCITQLANGRQSEYIVLAPQPGQGQGTSSKADKRRLGEDLPPRDRAVVKSRIITRCPSRKGEVLYR